MAASSWVSVGVSVLADESVGVWVSPEALSEVGFAVMKKKNSTVVVVVSVVSLKQ